MMGERLRYSDAELQEFKELINSKIDSAKNDIRILKGAFVQENGTNDTYSSANSYEDGAGTLAKENNSILIARQEKFVRDLELALIRIENKTYGICKVTKKLIQKERLKLVPHATMSIEAKNMRG
ncbi:MAG: TraR/DksA family transcriptional regulator [Flavobacteriales bacterium]|nr:TraR/DksA family transcriptional regulator [Flavobacteriales bacterium]